MRPPEFADTPDGNAPGATVHLYAWDPPHSRSAICGVLFLVRSGSCFRPSGMPGCLLDAMLRFLRRLLCAMLRFFRRPLCATEFRFDPGARLRQHILQALAFDRGPAANPILGLYTHLEKLYASAFRRVGKTSDGPASGNSYAES